MKKIAAHLALAVSLCCSMGVASAASATSSWQDVSKWPDFTGGLWTAPNADGAPHAEDLPLKPQAQAAIRQAMGRFMAGAAGGTCIPRSMPRHLGNQFIYSRGMIVILGTPDYYMVVRRVYMDGRAHGNPEPTYFGHSIGHWDQDTLVIDTVGFLPDAQLTDGIAGQGQTHIVERYRLLAPGKLELKLTVENPAVLTTAWTGTRVYTLEKGEDTPEAYCTNNRDLAGGVDLQPPAQ
ncbi:MAG: hypothetical protein QM718_05090 [Steroidobacteraceae bacterium]